VKTYRSNEPRSERRRRRRRPRSRAETTVRARPGDTARFVVSSRGAARYEARIVRSKQPSAGPPATPLAPEPVAAPCNGSYSARRARAGRAESPSAWGGIRTFCHFGSADPVRCDGCHDQPRHPGGHDLFRNPGRRRGPVDRLDRPCQLAVLARLRQRDLPARHERAAPLPRSLLSPGRSAEPGARPAPCGDASAAADYANSIGRGCPGRSRWLDLPSTFPGEDGARERRLERAGLRLVVRRS